MTNLSLISTRYVTSTADVTISEWFTSPSYDNPDSSPGISSNLVILAMVFIAIVMAVGITGNLLTLIVIFQHHGKLRVAGLAFIANLAISDVLFLIIILPLRLVNLVNGTIPIDHSNCTWIGSVASLFKLVSMLSLASIALNRLILFQLILGNVTEFMELTELK